MSQAACCSDALEEVAYTRHRDGALVARIALLAATPSDAEQAPRVDSSAAATDADGDLELPRRAACEVLRVRCVLSSPLQACGLQVWRGALLLADFALSCGSLDGATALELGAGTGLVGLLAARRAERVLLTDVGDAVLQNCAANAATCARARVLRLDWTAPLPSCAPDSPHDAFDWTAADLADLRRTSVVFAADCVYDDTLTDALWSTLEALFALCPAMHAYVSVERRINFSAADLTARAHAFDHFRAKFHQVGESSTPAPPAASGASLVGRRIDAADVPQRVSYERVPELELWDIYRADVDDTCFV